MNGVDFRSTVSWIRPEGRSTYSTQAWVESKEAYRIDARETVIAACAEELRTGCTLELEAHSHTLVV